MVPAILRALLSAHLIYICRGTICVSIFRVGRVEPEISSEELEIGFAGAETIMGL
jgi:hypothetical protein